MKLIRFVQGMSFQAWAVLVALAVTITLMSCPPKPEPPWTPVERIFRFVGRLDRFSGGPADRWPDLVVSEIEGHNTRYISPVNGIVLSDRIIHRMKWWTCLQDFAVTDRCGDCVVVRWSVPDMYFVECLSDECLERSSEGRRDPWRLCSAVLAFSYEKAEAEALFKDACEGRLKPFPWAPSYYERETCREKILLEKYSNNPDRGNDRDVGLRNTGGEVNGENSPEEMNPGDPERRKGSRDEGSADGG